MCVFEQYLKGLERLRDTTNPRRHVFMEVEVLKVISTFLLKPFITSLKKMEYLHLAFTVSRNYQYHIFHASFAKDCAYCFINCPFVSV